MLDITMQKSDGVLKIKLEGRLNSVSSIELSQRIEQELEGVHRIEFDFADLEYISSAGLRILIAVQQHMQASGGEDVCVSNASGVVLDTLEMTGFQGVINVK